LELTKVSFELGLTSCSSRDGDNFILILVNVKVNQRLQGEVLVFNVDFSVGNKVIDCLPVLLSQVLVSARFHDWHGFLKGINKVLQLVNDCVGWQVPYELIRDFLVDF